MISAIFVVAAKVPYTFSGRHLGPLLAAGSIAMLLGVERAEADICSRVNSEARQPIETDSYYEGVTQLYGDVCTLVDRDDGRFDYYTASEGRCRSLPGFITWEKDGGRGFNICIFALPSSGSDVGQGSVGSAEESGANSCSFANDGACDDPGACDNGTDVNDCSSSNSSPEVAGSSEEGDVDTPYFEPYPFNKYRTEPNGYGTWDCSEYNQDAFYAKGPYSYSCRLTVLAHLADVGEGDVKKFIAIACGRGETIEFARHNASSQAGDLMYEILRSKANELGSSESFVRDNTAERCVKTSN